MRRLSLLFLLPAVFSAMPAAADAPVIATKKYVDSGLAAMVKNTIFDAFKISAESFQNRAEGFATAAQGAKADTAVQPAALNKYVMKIGFDTSWWKDTGIIPTTGALPGGSWKTNHSPGLNGSWIVYDKSRGYEFRGWSNCSSSSSLHYSFSSNLSENSNCWCGLAEGSWVRANMKGVEVCGSYCAFDCTKCMMDGGYESCSRSALLNIGA